MKVFEKINKQGCFILQDEFGQVINEFFGHDVLRRVQRDMNQIVMDK